MKLLLVSLVLVCNSLASWHFNSTQPTSMVWFDSSNNNQSTPGARGLHFMVLKDNYIWLGNGQRLIEWMNDLWRFDIQSNTWLPMLGTSDYYKVTDVPLSPIMTSGYPFARSASNVWTDNDNNIWLFGGIFGTYDTNIKAFGDMWFLNISNPEEPKWTWISGDVPNVAWTRIFTKVNESGVSNPGSRGESVVWKQDNLFFMFGGQGYGTNSSIGYLGDLWSYNPATQTWKHLGGSIRSTADPGWEAFDHEGEIGVPSSLNYPRYRHGGLGWVVNNVAYMSSGLLDNIRYLNDLWSWDSNSWTYWHENTTTYNYARYLQYSNDNNPRSRSFSIGWVYDNNLWLFSGDTVTNGEDTADIWVWNTELNKWAWASPADPFDTTNKEIPAPRLGAGMVQIGSKIIMYGGLTPFRGGPLSDMWTLDVSDFVMTEYVTPPPEKKTSLVPGRCSCGTDRSCLCCGS